MNKAMFNNRIHLVGRLTVLICLISFISLPIILSGVYNAHIDYALVFQNALPLLATFTVAGVSENLSYAPIIGAGALYTSCVTGDLSNMKVPASKNAMDLLGVEAGTEKGDLVSIFAASTCTIVTTTIALAGMLFLAPIIEPIYNNPIINPAFANLLPALFGALIVPTIISNLKVNIPVFVIPSIVLLVFGADFFQSNQGFILLFTALLAVAYSYFMSKDIIQSAKEDALPEKEEILPEE
ncbi:hypothetical protein JZO70_19555 [Enterococcus sp. 669A]|uniref:Uncharacterized protein n=1 Tax=Candidatus Enterococcus moelleringii TaxID=2815325 RepID=A0ABS3LFG0_9ENTE|nr:hypothetical protein [Enterococcus sp. 669A]MBO1308381.1 hypothetical protein [Enterococcus sp. 669A]